MINDSDILRDAIFEILENQLRLGNPPVVRETLDRLLADGHAEQEARRLTACVLAAEVHTVMHDKQKFDEVKYANALRALPKLSWD